MTVVVPGELQERIDRVLRNVHRGVTSERDAANEVISLIHTFASRERPSGEQGAWDKRAVGARFNELSIEVASTMDVPVEVLARAIGIATPGSDARLDRKVRSALSALTPATGFGEGEFQLAVTWLGRGGPASPNLMRLIADPEPLSGNAYLRLLVARNEADTDTSDSLISADVDAGCPASLVVHLGSIRANRTDAELAVGAIDVDRLRRESRWGDIAGVAVFLAESGWIEWSYEWSSAVSDERVPLIAQRGDLAGKPPHHEYLGDLCQWSFDTRVFAPLGLIDLLAGDGHRARDRASLCRSAEDAFLGSESWALAGHFALAQWITARTTENLDLRRAMLEDIHHRHTWLGQLQAQIDADLADIAALQGDPMEEDLRSRSASALESPGVRLHFGAFPYDRLLRQLPVNNAPASGRTT